MDDTRLRLSSWHGFWVSSRSIDWHFNHCPTWQGRIPRACSTLRQLSLLISKFDPAVVDIISTSKSDFTFPRRYARSTTLPYLRIHQIGWEARAAPSLRQNSSSSSNLTWTFVFGDHDPWCVQRSIMLTDITDEARWKHGKTTFECFSCTFQTKSTIAKYKVWNVKQYSDMAEFEHSL